MSSESTTGGPREIARQIGRYRVQKLIGSGAMGRVWLAEDPVLERHVAIKVLRDDLKIADDVRDGLIVRMRHEARAAARVPHPNLVVLHDMGEDETVGLYLVFEYVEGPTLKDRIKEGPLAAAQAARVIRELSGALSFAHRAGVLHRDIKPENVILSPTGAKLADFGIARVPNSTLTHAGGLLGTPAYSAPETFRDSAFSPSSDQFSLAATVYEAISGQRAFPGDDAAFVAAKIAHDDPPRFAAELSLSPNVDDVLQRAMSKRPEDRYESCEAFGAALVAALRPARKPAPSSSRRPAPAATPPLPQSQPPAMATPPLPRWEAPRERRIGQLVLGGVVVVITAGLLIHTALRSADATDATPATHALPAAEADRELDGEVEDPGPAGSVAPAGVQWEGVGASAPVAADASETGEPGAGGGGDEAFGAGGQGAAGAAGGAAPKDQGGDQGGADGGSESGGLGDSEEGDGSSGIDLSTLPDTEP